MTTIHAPHPLRQGLNALAIAIAVALAGVPVAAQAQAVPDAQAGARRPGMDTAANGVPVVNIVAPSAAGVSHNQFQSYNVGANGLILNNSGAVSQTQLAGMIVGNTHIGSGPSARIILNEVTGTRPSALNGYTEVAGKSADVVVANPNGITVNGGGFINTTHSVLTTGTPVFGGDGSLQAFRVTRGNIAISGGGLDATGVDRADLIARAVQANAKVWAHNLNVVTGANQVGYADLATQAIRGEGTAPGVSLDVAALGGMYADKIHLLGTEAGVGVRNSGEIAAQAGDFQLTSAGKLVVTGTLAASGNMAVDASAMDNSGTLAANGRLDVHTSGDAANSGALYAGQGALDMRAAGALSLAAGSDVYAGRGITLRGASVDNAGMVEAKAGLDLAADGRLANSGALVAGGATTAQAARIDNIGHWQSGGNLAITTQALHNLGLINGKGGVGLELGTLDAVQGSNLLAATDLVVTASGPLHADGVLQAGRDLDMSVAGPIDMGAQGVLRGGRTLTLDSTGKLTGAGLIQAVADATVHVGGLANSGTLRAEHDLALTVDGDLQSSGMLYAGQDANLIGLGKVGNTGKLYAEKGALGVAAAGALTLGAGGDVYAGQGVTLHGASVDNAGIVEARTSLHVTAASQLANSGSLRAAGNVTLAATGALTNAGKLYAIDGVLDIVAGAAFANAAGGDVYAGNGITLQGYSVTNAGLMESARALALTSQGDLGNTGTLLADGGDLTLSGRDLDNGGTVSAAAGATLAATGTLQSSGVVVGGADLDLRGQAVNLAGQLQAGRDLRVQGDTLANAGVLYAMRNATLAGGDFTQSADAVVLADGDITLDNRGMLTNRGVLQAGQDLHALQLAGLDNTTGGTVQAGGDLGLGALGALTNHGALHAVGQLAVQAGALTNAGLLRSGAAQTVRVDGDADNQGSAWGGAGAQWIVGGQLSNAGTLAAQGNLHIDAASVASTGVLGAGVQADGSLGGSGALDVEADAGLIAQGRNLAASTLDLSGASLNLDGATTRAGGAATLTARTGDLSLRTGDLATADTLTLDASGVVDNTGGKLQGGLLALDAASLLNRNGQLLQTGASASTLRVSGTLDNGAGSIASNAATWTVQAGDLLNADGSIAHAGGGQLTLDATGRLDNAAGAIASNGVLGLTSNGAFGNADGRVSAAGNVTLGAQSLDNTGGTLAGNALDLTTRQAVQNAGGTLQAGSSLLLHAASLANGNGQIKALGSDALSLYISQALGNGSGGFIAGNGGVDLHAGSLVNAGQVYAGASLAVTSDAAIDNRNGALQAMGAASVQAGGKLDNGHGRIESGSGGGNATLTLGASTLDNSAGRLANAATGATVLALGSGALTNTGGTLGGQGDVTVTAGAVTNTGGGTVVAGRDLGLTASGLDNASGTLYAARNLTWSNRAATLGNRGGHLGAGGNTMLTLATLDNAAGETAASGNVTLDLGSLLGSGRVVAGNDLGLTLAGNYTNVAGNTLKANRNATLTFTGNLDNASGATLDAVGALAVKAAAITNSGTVNSAATTLTATGALTNRGRIEGDSVALTAASVGNTGTIIGGAITAHAGSLTNGADLGSATDNTAYDSATIAATGNIGLYLSGTLLNRDALIYAMGDLTVAANASGGRASAITNRAGSIEADGGITLAASQITNERRVFDTETYVLTPTEQGFATTTTGDEFVDKTTDPDTVAFCAGLDKNHRCDPDGNASARTTYTEISQERLALTSAQGRIVAGQDIVLGGSVLNDKSTVAAGRNLRINGQSGSVGEGSATLGGETIRNIGWVPTAQVRTDIVKSILEQKKSKCGLGTKSCWNDNGITQFGQSSSYDTLPLSGTVPYWLSFPMGGPDAPSYMTAGSTLEIHGTTIANTTVGADGKPVSAAATLGGNTASGAVTGVGAGHVGSVDAGIGMGGVGALGDVPAPGTVGTVQSPAGTAMDTSTHPVRNAGPAPGAQTVGTLDAPGGHIALPGNGLFTVHPGAAAGYLVESDPRFASMSGFYGSDYLMDRLDWNGEATLKRLGDAFYENRLVIDQITALTGRRLLSNDTDAVAQYRALMDAGLTAAKRFDLTVGVALTEAQMASLGEDIVWLVSQQVDGESVLVPVVYLSARHAQALGSERGAVLAGQDIILDASGSLTNTGQVLASRDASLKAGSLLNSGNIDAANTLSISAAQDVLNAGRISGGNVAVVAGRDVMSGAELGRVELGGIDLGASLTPLDAQRMGLGTGGTLTAAGNLAVQAGRDLTLDQAPISAGRDLSLVAGRDFSATATPISAGGDAALVAGRDMDFLATEQTTYSGSHTSLTRTTTHTVASVTAGGNLAVAAGRDLTSEGAAFKAGDTLVASAGRDLTLDAVTDVTTNREHHKEGRTSVSTTRRDDTVRGTTLDAANGMVVSAGRDLTATAATLGSRDGDIALAAGHDIALNAAGENHDATRDTRRKKSGLLSSKTTTTHDETHDQWAVGTSIDGRAVTLAAGHDLSTEGAQLTASDALALSAGHDVILGAAADSHSEQHERHTTQRGGGLGVLVGTSKGDLMTRTRKGQQDASSDITAVGSLLSGDTVTVAAGHDLTTQAAQIAGTGDVVLAAGHNLTLGAADNVHSEDHGVQVTTTGAQRSGLHGMFGVSKAGQAGTETDTTPSGSLVGSTDGSVTLSAGQDVRISASDVLSQTGTAVVGQNVTIEAGVGTADSHQSQSLHTGGIVGGLTGGAASAAEQVWASGQRAGQVKDKRLAALYAAQAGYAVSDAYQGISNGVAGAQGQAVQGNQNEDGSASASGAQGAANASGVSLRIGIGASSAAAHSDSHDDIAYASHIQSEGDVTIAATGGDLNLIGSQVSGDNVTLAAAHNLNLLSQVEQHTQKESSANASGEVGLSIGSTTGIYVSVAGGKGRAHGNGQTHATSDVQARDTLHLASGNDTTVQGAQARGNTVLADIGGNLGIASEQDTGDYASTNVQAGITFVYGFSGSGVGVSGNLAYGQMDSDYASVTQVSGLAAGSGGYHLDVGGNTDLKGGVIASTADPKNNRLSTGTLTYSDIANKAHYDAFSVSIGGGYGTGAMSGGSFNMGGSIPQDHSSHSTTQAGIAQGAIEVRNGPADLSGLDRNPDIDAQGLKSIFDREKVQEQQEMGQVAGYVGMRAAGTLAERMYAQAEANGDEKAMAAWRDGGTSKMLLHGLVGAATAALGGGDVLQGALGAGASEKASGAMQAYLLEQGIDPDSGKGKALMELASAAVGGVAGGGSGAVTALDGELYNRQLHPDYVEHLQSKAEAFAQQQCGCRLSQLPKDQQEEWIDNATQTLLVTAQRLQDDTFNASFDGAPLDAAAEAFIQNDPFGEWIGGTYYDMSHANAEQRADPNINGYALYQRLSSSGNGGLGPLMSATGYDLTQYYVLGRNDYYSGEPQSQAIGMDIYQAQQQSGKDFLGFQGSLALNGMVAGLTGGLGNVAVEATAGTRIGNILEYALTTRTGTAATGAVVNAGAQAAKKDGHVDLVEAGTTAAAGYLGFGRGFWWNTALGASAGVVNTEYGNLANGTDDSVWLGGATGGLTTGIGYGSGELATNWLANGRQWDLGPVVWGNFFGSSVSEGAGYLIQPGGREDEKNQRK